MRILPESGNFMRLQYCHKNCYSSHGNVPWRPAITHWPPQSNATKIEFSLRSCNHHVTFLWQSATSTKMEHLRLSKSNSWRLNITRTWHEKNPWWCTTHENKHFHESSKPPRNMLYFRESTKPSWKYICTATKYLIFFVRAQNRHGNMFAPLGRFVQSGRPPNLNKDSECTRSDQISIQHIYKFSTHACTYIIIDSSLQRT